MLLLLYYVYTRTAGTFNQLLIFMTIIVILWFQLDKCEDVLLLLLL